MKVNYQINNILFNRILKRGKHISFEHSFDLDAIVCLFACLCESYPDSTTSLLSPQQAIAR